MRTMPNCTTLPAALQGEQDLARVDVAVLSAVQDLDVDEVAVVCLHGDGHVMLVDEQVGDTARGTCVGGDDSTSAGSRRTERVQRACGIRAGECIGKSRIASGGASGASSQNANMLLRMDKAGQLHVGFRRAAVLRRSRTVSTR